MKRLISLFLVVCICFSPAMAAEDGFSAVPAGSWYESAVGICVDAGLMSGTGGGRFNPDGPLSKIECLALAARLHEIQNGGDGVLPQAPEDWGKITLTTADGTIISDYGDSGTWRLIAQSRVDSGHLCMVLDTLPLSVWGETQSGKTAMLITDGGPYMGSVTLMTYDTPVLCFEPESDTYQEAAAAIHHAAARCPGPDKWYRDAFYYAEYQSLGEDMPAHTIYDNEAADRFSFARALAAASGSLEPVNAITALPDADAETVLDLYNAGILTGTDKYGTFGGSLGLTRAEAAVMLARVLEPETRLTFTPSPLPFRDYTLTELDTGDAQSDSCPWVSSEYLMLYRQNGGESLLRADGSPMVLEEGISFSTWNGGGLLVLEKADPSLPSGYARGVMDASDGHMVLPFARYDECTLTPDNHILTRVNSADPNEGWALRDSGGTRLTTLYGPADRTSYNEGLSCRYDEGTGLWGYADNRGDWALAPQWGSYTSFRDGYAVVSSDGGCGVIDKNGRYLIPPVYPELSYCGGGLFAYRDWGALEQGWVWADGRTARSGYAASDARCSGGYIAIGNRYLNADGVPVTPVFEWVGPVAEDGGAFVGLDGKVYRLQFVE